MSSFNPVFDPRVGEASRRRFDPYPDALLALDFAGVNPSGRPFYKRDGIVSPRFEMMRGASSVGGAGFGTTIVNGVYETFAPNTPLIGDGGLRNAEARTNSIQNPTFQNAVAGTPGTHPSFMNFGVGGVNRRIVGTGTENGLPYIEVRFWGTNTGSTQPVTIFLNDPGAPATVGQAWTASLQLRLMAGSWDNVNTALFRIYEQQGLTFLASSPTTSVKGTGGSITPYSQQHTLAQPSVDNTKAVVSLGVTVGATIDLTLRLYAPNLKLGPDINDPPILQESGLPATRTGYSYQQTGLSIAPVHYGVARARFMAPLANHATPFPRIWSLRPSSGVESLILGGIKSDGRATVTAFGDGTSGGITFAENPVPGIYQTVAWARRGASLAISFNGGATQTAPAPPPPSQPYTRVAYCEDASGPGVSTANAEIATFATWNGEISDAALQALSARFAA